nr:hypothetical protein Iba_chr08aCG11810 [Ipomoea batatas]
MNGRRRASESLTRRFYDSLSVSETGAADRVTVVEEGVDLVEIPRFGVRVAGDDGVCGVECGEISAANGEFDSEVVQNFGQQYWLENFLPRAVISAHKNSRDTDPPETALSIKHCWCTRLTGTIF